MARVVTGLERLVTTERARVRGRNVGLLAHPASVLAETLTHALDALIATGAHVRALFGPEHGYAGEAQDMVGVADARDARGMATHSLYGNDFASLSPRREWLDGLDVVVIDLQDVGSRYYTFVWTAVLMARACHAAGVETLVLDRPNPLGGRRIEGPPQRPELCSFVGLRPVPVRHGLTIGEIVRDAAQGEHLGGVSILEMQGWRRGMWFGESGLPWIAPSPNMPTLDTALVYPGGCLLEGTNVSEGRGTTRPFEIFGAPWASASALRNGVGDRGCIARVVAFEPMFHKFARSTCNGVQIHVTDRETFEPYRSYLGALVSLRKHPEFAWRTDRYEFVDAHPAIDLLTGDADVRLAIDSGATANDLVAIGARRLAAWGDPRERWLYVD